MNEEYPKAYAVLNKDEHIRFLSTSGGIFSLLAEYMIKMVLLYMVLHSMITSLLRIYA